MEVEVERITVTLEEVRRSITITLERVGPKQAPRLDQRTVDQRAVIVRSVKRVAA